MWKPIHLKTRKQESINWKIYYWIMVVAIFLALVFMVRFVLNSSKIYIDKTTIIDPYYIEWKAEKDGSFRLNDPYYIKGHYKFIHEDLDKLKLDPTTYNPLIINSKTGGTLSDVPQPFLIWKRANSDTIHILKNNIVLNFKYSTLD